MPELSTCYSSKLFFSRPKYSKDGRKEKARNDGKHHPAAPKRALPFAAADRGLLLPPAHASTRTPHALLLSWRGELICS